ncbi:DUF1190 domain-containing protein [Phreatobacter sp. AB_2022a]|uniref:DUF1190 domain-containing protein n=1 Tax=Phreatobacter sp. AB_2022a TaxID=3003134 RepID=UPI0022875699|nr:DUF1190 domain-containing protein [Phreatobacter sp. AB_2022a]MCZ0733391.1 DUF1190 domain-containing protein [Phreatobacter sp. AB_2022a]
MNDRHTTRGAVAVGLIVAGVAATMGYVWFRGGDCPGGTEIPSERACLASGRAAGQCRALLAEATALLARSGPVYATREACQDRHTSCQESRGAAGFAPRATGFCLMPGAPARIVPRFAPA